MGFLRALGSKKKSDRRNKQHWQAANCEPKATSIELRRQRENNTQKAALMATGSRSGGGSRRAKQEGACGSKRYYDYDYVYYVVIRLSAIFTSFFPLFLLLKFASSCSPFPCSPFSCRYSAPPATCPTCAICCSGPASSGVVNSTLLVRRHFRLALAYDT